MTLESKSYYKVVSSVVSARIPKDLGNSELYLLSLLFLLFRVIVSPTPAMSQASLLNLPC